MSQIEREQPLPAADADKTKVFVSYSRKDRDFVDRLVKALEAHEHIAVYRDADDVLPTEEWKGRLEKLIGEADTIVFCLSPDSTASEVCHWEVEVAERLNKRIAPIMIRNVERTIPNALAKLNYIFFTSAEDFDRSLGYLITALDVDIGWIREHTRLGELSRHWERSGQPRDQLLRGVDLDAAEAWSKRRPRKAPEPTEITLSYIAASRKEAVTQVRRTLRIRVVVGVLILGIVAGFTAWRNEQWLKEHIYWLANVRGHVLTTARERALKPKDAFKECTVCPEMVVVPAGSFLMGSPADEKDRSNNEDPQHKVTIAKPFAVSRFELTFAEWDACAAHGDCDARVSASDWGRGRQPAINVSWDDAQQYVAWLSKITGQPYRLLTEAEWEYAARGGRYTAYSWDDEVGKGNANCSGCGSRWDGKQAAPVGSFAPNAFGLHDMHGNVWEWVEDVWHGNYDGAPSDGSAWTEGGDASRHVVRGGSWNNEPQNLRAVIRDRVSTDNRFTFLGFRVGRTLSP